MWGSRSLGMVPMATHFLGHMQFLLLPKGK